LTVSFYLHSFLLQKTMMLLRIAQGLVHLGKGTQTLNPFHSDRQLMCPTTTAALLTTCMAFIDADQSEGLPSLLFLNNFGILAILNGRQHYLLFTLVAAIQPRMLVTVVQDENDKEQLVQKPVRYSILPPHRNIPIRPFICKVQVRVGQAVDVVAQAGKPRTITGFQTHTTPVLLAYGERAELADEECE
jgi:26S proteasome regulatory subunit N1